MQNRLSGIFVFLFGVLIFFVLIPLQTETVDYGWLRPATLPSVAAAIICVAGLVQCAVPRGTAQLRLGEGARALLFLVLGLGGLWGMHVFGFMIAAPTMMLVIMLVIGERRWLWLITGTVLLPAFIWFCIDFVLKRPLP